ncbi:MAG: hypothetical protein R2839_12070 [Thermomicrobiales bacterium]
MMIGFDPEDRAAHRVQRRKGAFVPQIVEMEGPFISPSIQVEGIAAIVDDAVGLHDIASRRQQSFD